MKFAFQEKWILARRSEASPAFEPERRAWPGRDMLSKKAPGSARRSHSIRGAVLTGPPGGRQDAKGVALVITLILLAVITTLAIAFLALTYRETASVDSMGRTTDAELAVGSAFERAKAEILAPYPVQNKNFGVTGPSFMGPEMFVSMGYDTNRFPPTNSFYNPTPPVFVDTNRPGQNGPPDDRFFLDLNRNGYFEESGIVNEIDDFGRVVRDQSGNIVTNFVRGDPQWIGLPQDPSRPHGPDNRYIGRFAYLVLPAGRSLDVNWMHNQALGVEMRANRGAFPSYYRNQGVGTWELNLGAFLADLNPTNWNVEPYEFHQTNVVSPIAVSRGTAFTDAMELLRYRYTSRANPPTVSPHLTLDTMDDIFGVSPGTLTGTLGRDEIDTYTDGLFDLSGRDNDDSRNHWPGADSKQHFFSLHEFVNPKLLSEPNGFVARVAAASAGLSTTNRYTYYRMLAQLGTDSTGDEEGKININYVNVAGIGATNLIPWTDESTVLQRTGNRYRGPELFLISVATNIFRREMPELVDNARSGQPFRIPVFTNGSWFGTNGRFYSGRIHQVFQLAANILDATRGDSGADAPRSSSEEPRYFPSVFRPVFEKDNGTVYIVNYKLVPNYSSVKNMPWRHLESGEVSLLAPDDGVYGIPFIVGARRGFPNFNEFAMQTVTLATRRLDYYRQQGEDRLSLTNQLLTLTVSNQVSMEAWNSYRTPYPRTLNVIYGNRSTAVVANNNGAFPASNYVAPYAVTYPANTWKGPNKILQESTTGCLAMATNHLVLDWSLWSPPDPPGFTNHWTVNVTNRVLFFMVDADSDRVVDAVTLSLTNLFEVAKEMHRNLRLQPENGKPLETIKRPVAQLWNTERYQGPEGAGGTVGVASQYLICSSYDASTDDDWKDYNSNVKNKADGMRQFTQFVTDKSITNMTAPFTAARLMIQTNSWQVNDPLVHYTEDDLWSGGDVATVKLRNFASLNILGRNPRFTPWGGKSPDSVDPETSDADPNVRDSAIYRSDDWKFPTNKLATIGWLGRVHRGTPWQTVYLKSGVADAGKWRNYTGMGRSISNALAFHPTNDWWLTEIFTTAIHSNAARGRMSINQTNLAAWSAVLAGVDAKAVVTIDVAGASVPGGTNALIQPASIDPAPAPLERILTGINRERANRPNRQFTRLGHILSVPELTLDSPYIKDAGYSPKTGTTMVTDADLEHIPEQVLSLLKVGEPRFVVYAWGQSLKPARNGVVRQGQELALAGPSIATADDGAIKKGLCINYQITGELAIRAVVRVEFEKDPVTQSTDYRKPHAVVESYNIIPVE